jgi:4-hydroxybenzoate polyprenyltransferase
MSTSPARLPVADRLGLLLLSMRPGNAAIAALGVPLGAWLARGDQALAAQATAGTMPTALLLALFADFALFAQALLGGLAIALLVGAGNLHNDLTDLEIDKINRPDRPLASGRLTPRDAWIATIGATALALLLAALAPNAGALLFGGPFADPTPHLLLAAAIASLLALYNRRLKGLPVVGNLAVALLCTTPFLWSGFPHLSPRQWAATLPAFLFTLVRELLKDIEDLPGDGARGLRTLPVLLGSGPSAHLALALLALALPLSLLPRLLGIYGNAYLVGVLLLALPGSLGAAHWTFHSCPPAWGKAQRWAKFAILGGTLALVAEALLPHLPAC